MAAVWWLAFFLSWTIINLVSGVDVTVNTKYGPVVGVTQEVRTVKFRQIDTFYAIPFAKSPTGQRRFKPPEEPDRWTTPREAKELGAACPQPALGMLLLTHPLHALDPETFDEDCLHLNIFTPSNKSAGPFSVFYWVHGGAYQGSANIQYPGHFLASRGITVVIINYRLGPLGFMSTADDASPGNYGLMDAIQGLKFVRDNIRNFGGDPGKVTIAGQSAGAGVSGLLDLIPAARGLFHQILLESGTDQALWSVLGEEQKPESYTRTVASQLGCPTADSTAMMDCLRSDRITTDDLIDAEFNCTPGHLCLGFAPVVDGTLLPDHPHLLRRDGEYVPMPLLAGQTTEDGSLYTIAIIPESWDTPFNRSEFHRHMKTMINYFALRFPEKAEDIYRAMDFHFSPWPHVEDAEANRQKVNEIVTDIGFSVTMDRHMKLVSEKDAPVYSWLLGYRSPNGEDLFPLWMGVPHMGELPYVFGYPLLQDNANVRDQQEIDIDIIRWTEEDKLYTHFIQELWTNFVKHGDPTPYPVDPPFGGTPLKWERFRPGNLSYAYLGNTTVENRLNYRQKNVAFWTRYMRWLLPDLFERNSTRVATTAAPSVICLPCTSSTVQIASFPITVMVLNLFTIIRLL